MCLRVGRLVVRALWKIALTFEFQLFKLSHHERAKLFDPIIALLISFLTMHFNVYARMNNLRRMHSQRSTRSSGEYMMIKLLSQRSINEENSFTHVLDILP